MQQKSTIAELTSSPQKKCSDPFPWQRLVLMKLCIEK